MSSSCLQPVNDVLNGFVGFVIGGFEFTVWAERRVRFVMESTFGERTTEALVKEQEEESDGNAFGGKAIGLAAAMASEQSVAVKLAQVVAELVQCVLFRGKLELVTTASWICLAVQPPTVVPLCRRTSSRRMIRPSWILIPGQGTELTVMGMARRGMRGESTWRLRLAPGRRRSGR